MKRTIGFILTILGMSAAFSVAARATVSQDANGWTVVTPSPDSRIIYVSATDGNDATTTGYVPGSSFAPGLSPRDGIPSSVTPYKTLAQAVAQMRDGSPDWILLKSGDVWNKVFPSWENSGRSAGEPLLISSYGSGPRPRINTGSENGFQKFEDPVMSYIFIIGLEFWENLNDPADPNFNPNSSPGKGIVFIQPADDLLVEDCSFSYFQDGVIYETNGWITNLRLRRNIFVDGYNVDNGVFVQGAFLANINGLLLEENLFDHNGWNVAQGANGTMFNHNTYIDTCNNVTMRRNLILRAASLDAKFRSGTTDGMDGVLVDNNLIFEGEYGIGIGGNGESDPLKFQNMTITNNVLLNLDKDEAPGWNGLALGIMMADSANALIAGNLVVNQPTFDNSTGIVLRTASSDGGAMSNVTVRNNLLFRVAGVGIQMDASAASPGGWQNVLITGNAVQAAEVNAGMFEFRGSLPLPGLAFSNNTYYTLDSSGWALISGYHKNYAYWQSLNWDVGSTNQQITYPDPLRDLTSYQQMLTKNPSATELDFIAAARAQSRANWNPAYTAAAVNDFIRAGFAIAPLEAPTPPAGLTPTAVSSFSVTLAWTESSPVTGFKVERSTDNWASVGLAGATANVLAYLDGSLSAGTTYYYRVRATNSSGDSNPSNAVQVRTLAAGVTQDNQPPTAPPTFSTTTISSTAVSLLWGNSTDNASVAKYWVLRNNVIVATVTAPTSFIDTGLTASTPYFYKVEAVDPAGNVGPPATLTVTTPAASTGGGSGGGTTASSVTLLGTAAFPNPAVGKAPTIRAFVGDADELEITIYDAAGSVVHSDRVVGGPTGTASNGQPYYDYVWTGKRASGVYYAVIHGKKGGDVVRARVKFAIVR